MKTPAYLDHHLIASGGDCSKLIILWSSRISKIKTRPEDIKNIVAVSDAFYDHKVVQLSDKKQSGQH